MAVSEVPRRPPPPHPVVILLLVLILAGVLYSVYLLNTNFKSIEQSINNVPAQQAR